MIDEFGSREDLIKELIALRQENQQPRSHTEFKIAAETKPESQQLMEQVIELLPDATLVIDLEGKVVFWNKTLQYMTGVTKDQIIGKGNYEYAIPFYDERRPILIDLALNEHKISEVNGKYEFIGQGDNYLSGEVYVPKTYDGKGAYLWGYACKLYDMNGNIYGAIQSIRDISDRKHAEIALRGAEERFSQAFMSSPVPMSISRQEDGVYVDVNDSFLQTTGFLREEVIGRSSLDLNIWTNPEDRAELVRRLQKDGKVKDFEGQYNTKHGQKRLALFSSEKMITDKAECMVTLFIDITERRQVEKELARLDRLNLIGEMAASIGHEIRNPMTAVRGFIQLLNEQERCEEDKLYFKLMIEELDRANGIITEYLGMAKDKIVELHPQYLDQIVEAIFPMLRADVNHKGMNIQMDLGKPAKALVDENEVRQLILNMARNGLEAMSSGGTLTIGTRSGNGKLTLYIKDEGHGLNSEVIDKLGTPFITTKDKGTGLGLAVCYSIAARHGATISFETNSDGTTFYISFPLYEGSH